eukprot:gene5855-7284_t
MHKFDKLKLSPVPRIGILGGGIAGLSVYHFIRKGLLQGRDNPLPLVTIYEKSNKLGGCLDTKIIPDPSASLFSHNTPSFILEQGPRSLRSSTEASDITLELLKNLGLLDDVIFADVKSKKKLLMLNDKVTEIPMKLVDALKFAYKHSLIGPILKEPFRRVPRMAQVSDVYDESVRDFFIRRMGKHITDTFIEPMCLGIYGGDYSRLSMWSCFPSLAKKEAEKGSLVLPVVPYRIFPRKSSEQDRDHQLAFISPHREDQEAIDKFKKEKDKHKVGVFSLKNGLGSIVKSIEDTISKDNLTTLKMNENIKKVIPIKRKGRHLVQVVDEKGHIQEFDHLISTIPFHASSPLFKSTDTVLSQLLQSLEYTSIAVVNLVYCNDPVVSSIVESKGFGYLIPSKENQSVLGVCIDSNTFPQFVDGRIETNSILTVMIGGNQGIQNPNWINVEKMNNSKEELTKIAQSHLSKYLGIQSNPTYINVKVWSKGIPHYNVGHRTNIHKIEKHCLENRIPISFCGNSTQGVSVNDTILTSKSIAKNLLYGIYCDPNFNDIPSHEQEEDEE